MKLMQNGSNEITVGLPVDLCKLWESLGAKHHGIAPKWGIFEHLLERKSANKKWIYLCLFPVVWAVHAQWLLPWSALHELIKLCKKSSRLWEREPFHTTTAAPQVFPSFFSILRVRTWQMRNKPESSGSVRSSKYSSWQGWSVQVLWFEMVQVMFKVLFSAHTACGTVFACKVPCDWQEGPQTCKDLALFMYLFCNLKQKSAVGRRGLFWKGLGFRLTIAVFPLKLDTFFKKKLREEIECMYENMDFGQGELWCWYTFPSSQSLKPP